MKLTSGRALAAAWSAAIAFGAVIVAAVAVPPAHAQTANPLQDPAILRIREAFAVDGIALFDAHAQHAARMGICAASVFAGLKWCVSGTGEESRGDATYAKTTGYNIDADSRIVYAISTRRGYPLKRDGFEAVIASINARFGAGASVYALKTKAAEGAEVDSLIAVWGGLRLVHLSEAEYAVVEGGGSLKRGHLVDHRFNLVVSAKQREPVYKIEGEAGYILHFMTTGAERADLVARAVYAPVFLPAPAKPADVPGNPIATDAVKPPKTALHDRDVAAERGRRAEAERALAAERLLREEAERKLLETQRALEELKKRSQSDRKAGDDRAQREQSEREAAQRKADEAKRAESEAARKAAEAKRQMDDADRKAAENKRQQDEVEQKAAEHKASEGRRAAQERIRRAELEQKAAEQKAAEQKTADAKRLKEEAARKAEAERKAAEERREAERKPRGDETKRADTPRPGNQGGPEERTRPDDERDRARDAERAQRKAEADRKAEAERAARDRAARTEDWYRKAAEAAAQAGIAWTLTETQSRDADAGSLFAQAIVPGPDGAGIELNFECALGRDRRLKATARGFDRNTGARVPFRSEGEGAFRVKTQIKLDDKPAHEGLLFRDSDDDIVSIVEAPLTPADVSIRAARAGAWLRHHAVTIEFRLMAGTVRATVAPYAANLRRVLEACAE